MQLKSSLTHLWYKYDVANVISVCDGLFVFNPLLKFSRSSINKLFM